MSRLSRALLLVGALALVDQLIKGLVVLTMPLGSAIEILPFLALFHTRNEGIAFSFLSGFHGWGLALISTVVLGFIAWLWRGTPPERRWSHWGFALVAGGAVGNLVDRVALGYVVDYVYFHTPVWSFAVFNLADAFITVGAVLILLDEVWFSRERKRADEAP